MEVIWRLAEAHSSAGAQRRRSLWRLASVWLVLRRERSILRCLGVFGLAIASQVRVIFSTLYLYGV